MKIFNIKSGGISVALLIALLLMGGAQAANAATLKVGAGLNPAVAGNYSTIAPAIAAAVAGDVIDVGAGTYGETFTVPANVILRGAGSNLTKIVGNISTGASAMIRNVGITGEIYVAPSVSILDSTLTGYIRAAANSPINVRVVNVVAAGIYQSSYPASYLMHNLYVSNSRFTGWVGIPASNDTVFVNNDIQGRFFVGARAIVKGNTFSNFIANTGGRVYDPLLAVNRTYYNYIEMDRSTSCVFENNVIDRSANTTTAEIVFAVGCKVENNTFTARTDNLQAQGIGSLWKNNIIVSSLVAPSTIDANGNMVGNPAFVNAATGDYHLAAGSAALGAGVGLNANGSVADLGAYGGVGSQFRVHNVGTVSQPEVNQVLIQPNPVSPGETLRLRFSAQTH